MARRPASFTWLGFTPEQVELLESSTTSETTAGRGTAKTGAVMPKLMQEFADSGVELVRIKETMAAIGYGKHALHELDRWESKCTTGRFGR